MRRVAKNSEVIFKIYFYVLVCLLSEEVEHSWSVSVSTVIRDQVTKSRRVGMLHCCTIALLHYCTISISLYHYNILYSFAADYNITYLTGELESTCTVYGVRNSPAPVEYEKNTYDPRDVYISRTNRL